jgi:hypothetical protein
MLAPLSMSMKAPGVFWWPSMNVYRSVRRPGCQRDGRLAQVDGHQYRPYEYFTRARLRIWAVDDVEVVQGGQAMGTAPGADLGGHALVWYVSGDSVENAVPKRARTR